VQFLPQRLGDHCAANFINLEAGSHFGIALWFDAPVNAALPQHNAIIPFKERVGAWRTASSAVIETPPHVRRRVGISYAQNGKLGIENHSPKIYF
jgi:hypothetical protein